MEWYEKKRGRPFGATTKSRTPGFKRARAFAHLQYEQKIGTTAAARTVAEENDVDTFQIFKDFNRHLPKITAELVAASPENVGPQIPNDAKVLVEWIAVTTFRGQRLK